MERNDSKVVTEGRKNALDVEEVPLREQVIRKLYKKLVDLNEGENTVRIWNAANAERSPWLVRQQALLQRFDEFLKPLYDKSQDWMSTLHLPVTLTVCKTYHARMYAALMGIDPPFTVKARKASNQDRSMLVQELMRYALSNWANNYKGIEEVVDAWLWSWITAGSGILKQRWDRKYSRFIDVVQKPKVKQVYKTLNPDGSELEIPDMEIVEAEEEVTETVFDGPTVEFVPLEDIVIVGGKGDPDEADDVIHSTYMTASELWTLSDTGVFREEAVQKVIKSGENAKSGEPGNNIKVQQAESAGTGSLDKPYDLQRYQILERYAQIDVDGSGINSDVILWVHKETREILRATYLRRVTKSGLRPFSKIDFHKRYGQDYGVGLPELLYSIESEIDAIHNIKIDIGIQTSLPMGFYKPTSSTVEEKLEYGPGELIPLDSPQTDVVFPNLGNRTAFASGEEASLYGFIERFTSLSDLSFGSMGSQGAARTASGVRALVGESNANLDIYLRRMNRGWRRVLTYMFHQLQEKLPDGFEFRIFGDDGQTYFQQVKSKEELCGMYDFELEPNSANSNKQIQLETANQVYQMTGNMLDVQLGIITPLQRYEAIKNLLQVMGIKDFARFIQKPQGQARIYTPIEIADATLAGVNIPLGPEQDLQGFIAWVEGALQDPEILGYFNQEHVNALVAKMQEAQALLQAMEQQQRQFANQQQVQTNAGLASAAALPQTPGAAPATAIGAQ